MIIYVLSIILIQVVSTFQTSPHLLPINPILIYVPGIETYSVTADIIDGESNKFNLSMSKDHFVKHKLQNGHPQKKMRDFSEYIYRNENKIKSKMIPIGEVKRQSKEQIKKQQKEQRKELSRESKQTKSKKQTEGKNKEHQQNKENIQIPQKQTQFNWYLIGTIPVLVVCLVLCLLRRKVLKKIEKNKIIQASQEVATEEDDNSNIIYSQMNVLRQQ